jgi:hypothetical protein
MSCWDGQPLPPRDEDQWEDSDDGDMPWSPNPVDGGLPWQPRNWTDTPEEKMHRDKLEDFDIVPRPPTGSIEESVKDDAQWERDDEPEEDEDA